MSNFVKPIVVPWDFSEKSEVALLHALMYYEFTKTEIVLLNIVKKKKEVNVALLKLDEKIDKIKTKNDVVIHGIVEVGNIFSTISNFLKTNNATMAIMGTHGMKGFQKITGSWALKVIAGSSCPFIVVHKAPTYKKVKDIVVPIDFRAENKQKIIWTNFLHKLFNAKFYLCYTDTTDKIAKKNLLTNIKVTTEYMNGKGIDYELKKLEGIEENVIEILTLAHKLEASLILVLTTKNIKSIDYMIGVDEQRIIANEENFPIMCINPKNI